MNQLNLFFIRHCKSVGNDKEVMQGWVDYSLSDEGLEQEDKVKNELSKIQFDKVFTSPLSRARHTAELFNKKSQVVVLDKLKERNLGIFSGLTEKEAESLYKEHYNAYKFGGFDEIPKAETTEELIKRCHDLKNEITSLKEGNYLFVSHGIILSCLLPLLSNEYKGVILNNGEIVNIKISGVR